MPALLSPASVKSHMRSVPKWKLKKNSIDRSCTFADFGAAMDFVNAVAEIAEEEDHHPEIGIKYNKVVLSLSTHSEGGLTEFDFTVAERIDEIADSEEEHDDSEE